MKCRLALALVMGAVRLTAYGYDYGTYALPPPPNGPFSQNNPTPYDETAPVFTFNGNGSSILLPAVSGNPNDYETRSYLALQNSAVGTYIHFLRANSSTVVAGVGSYISVEITRSGNLTGQLNINQCVNGVVTQLGSTAIVVFEAMQLRTIVWGNTLWVFTDGNWPIPRPPVLVWSQQIPMTTGNPGFGGYNLVSGNGFYSYYVGHRETVPPNPLPVRSISESTLPNQVSFRWTATTDDAAGIGMFQYLLARNGVQIATVRSFEVADDTVVPATTYNYQIGAQDMHGNIAWTPLTITTPPATAVDPRRVGLRPSGSYWGGGGEQMDTLSGNLNYSIPIVKATQRTGMVIPLNLSYNSQNWRQDSGLNWQLGNDIGYGFGWKLQFGSLTPYYSGWINGIDFYIFADGTGAEYRLSVNNAGVWSSTEGTYVWFDANANKLHFSDGSYWIMGATSAGSEPDPGTLYPTTLEDVNGNSIIVGYLPRIPCSNLYCNYANTSGRIGWIQDAQSMMQFSYNTDAPVPHLLGVSEMSGGFGVARNWGFSYSTGVLSPPFGADTTFAGVTTTRLTTLPSTPTGPYSFTYDTAGAGELTQVTMPSGGHLRWTYANDAFSGGRTLRALSGRYLAADSAGATEWVYGLSRDNAASAMLHSTFSIADASGIGAKTWNFLTAASTPSWKMGLLLQFVQLAAPGGTVMQRDSYTWSQDLASNPYISGKSVVRDEGTPNQQTATTQQTLDQYGNVTQSIQYPLNSATSLRTYNNTYLSGSNYAQYYVFNKLLTSSLTVNGINKTLVTNSYGYPSMMASGLYDAKGFISWMDFLDISGSPPRQYRGLLTASVNPAVSTTYSYYDTGGLSGSVRSDGTRTSQTIDSSTNYSAPSAISTESYSGSFSYAPSLDMTQATGANGEQVTTTYDSWSRPSSSVSPYGATKTYVYAPYTSPPTLPVIQTVTTDASKAYSKTTYDGLGRAIHVETGSTLPQQIISYIDTVYGPCACSPLGKLSKVSQPYAPGTTPVWTVYTYDGLGRTLSIQQPDGASTTTYAYSGNQTIVTDPAGKWKQTTSDVSGNLTMVVEPDPSNAPTGTLTTSYTYDWMNHVSQVSMPRGGTTQVRTFVYDDLGRLTSSTNPESGTVTYTYNPVTNTLQFKHDAKGQETVYTYDIKNRVTMAQYFPTGQNAAEDYCQRVSYWWDSGAAGANSQNRLSAVQYATSCVSGNIMPTYYTEWYYYHPAGALTGKRFGISRMYPGTNTYSTYNTDAGWSYNTEGRLSSMYYPFQNLSGWVGTPSATGFTFAFDAMGRPVSMTDNIQTSAFYYTCNYCNSTTQWVKNVQYDIAGRINSMQYITNGFDDGEGGVYNTYGTQTQSYNTSGQLASMNWSGGITGGIQYSYSPTQNNGQITQVNDSLSGETISYQYDALKRLTSADSIPNSGSSTPAWNQTFQNDGFGNLTSKTLNGTASLTPVNPATNRLANAVYDLNGNMTSGAGVTMTYDVSNRMTSAQTLAGGIEYYSYSPDNKQIYRMLPNGNEEFTFYGGSGEKLGVYGTTLRSYVYFAGKLISENKQPVFQDRLGTNRAAGARFRPYGEEITTTTNEREKFGTYTRDAYTGLDYADQRYFASTYGRFNTADPYKGSAGPGDPSSWNRYSYTRGDPINRLDSTGLDDCNADFCSDTYASGGYGGFGGYAQPVHPSPADPPSGTEQWQGLSPDCQKGLKSAVHGNIAGMIDALNRAMDQMSLISSAASANGVDSGFLASVALEESGVQNIAEKNGGAGRGIFQIDRSQNGSVSDAQAYDPAYSANWAAAYFASSAKRLAARFPDLTGDALTKAVADTYNAGVGGVSRAIRSGHDPDSASYNQHYGSTVVDLTKCFQ